MNKRVIGLVFLIICIMWCGRIYRVNQCHVNECIISMKDTYFGTSISLTPLEACLLDKDEFLARFPMTEEILDTFHVQDSGDSHKYICVCIEVTNISQQDITWDWVQDVTTCGFETTTWMSSNMDFIASKMNIFTDDCLKCGKSQKIWYVTGVNPLCFKNTTWKSLKCSDFKYVISLGKEKISVQLE